MEYRTYNFVFSRFLSRFENSFSTLTLNSFKLKSVFSEYNQSSVSFDGISIIYQFELLYSGDFVSRNVYF